MDAAVGLERAEDPRDVVLERVVLTGVGEDLGAGALDPSRVVQAGLRGALLPKWGNGSQTASNSTNITPMWCRSAIARNRSIRVRNPGASCSQSRWWRKTRTLLKPRSSAQPSSQSIIIGSNVSACHISSWLIAVLGA